MESFDFIKGFVGVDVLQVEAVSEVVGHCVAALFKGMTESGLSEENAHKIINDTIKVILNTGRNVPNV